MKPRLPTHLLRESDVKTACVKKLRALGCLVGCVGNSHRSQLPDGWPDGTVVLPRDKGIVLIEFKKPGGKLKPKQVDFALKAQAMLALSPMSYR